ncbi:MAG TPA: HEAT repeat domain-containing protein, partial [Flavisolibacter sp.]
MISALEMLSDSHPSDEIRAKCLYCIGTIAPDRLEQMKDFIFSQHPSICIAAVTVFLQSNNPQYYKKALDRLYHLATESVEEKKMASEIIGRCKRTELSPLLIQMLHDSELAVRQAAIQWAGEVPSRELIAPLVELLRQKPTRKHARQALIRLQLVAIEEMIALKLPQNDPVIPELARVAGAVVHERSAAFLLQCIQSHDQHRNEVIYALWQLAYAAEGPYAKTLHQVARQLLDEAASVADQLVASGSDSSSPHLKKALYYELRNLTDTILRLLSILYSREKLNQVILALDLKESFKTSNSLELLHVTLPSGIYAEVERLLDVVEMNYSLADKKTRYKTVVDVLEGIIMHAPRVYNRWTNAQAIYHSGEKKLRHIIHALKHSRREDKEPIVQETKMFVISQNT